MKKEHILKGIEYVRHIHKANLQHIEFCLRGMPLKEHPIPPSPAQCAINEWLINDAEALTPFFGVTFLKELVALHEQWHTEFAKIYTLYYPNENNGGFIGKFIKSKRKELTPMELERARAYQTDLLQTSEVFLKKLSLLERRVKVTGFD